MTAAGWRRPGWTTKVLAQKVVRAGQLVLIPGRVRTTRGARLQDRKRVGVRLVPFFRFICRRVDVAEFIVDPGDFRAQVRISRRGFRDPRVPVDRPQVGGFRLFVLAQPLADVADAAVGFGHFSPQPDIITPLGDQPFVEVQHLFQQRCGFLREDRLDGDATSSPVSSTRIAAAGAARSGANF